MDPTLDHNGFRGAGTSEREWWVMMGLVVDAFSAGRQKCTSRVGAWGLGWGGIISSAGFEHASRAL